MDKKKNVRSKRRKKKNRPKIRFKFSMIVAITIFSFAACFALYMIAANLNDDFFNEKNSHISSENSDTETAINEAEINSTNAPAADGAINPVPQSETADESYLENCCLITDNILIGMKSSGGFNEKNVFGSSQLTASGCMTTQLESSFGTMTANEIIKKKKPETLYIMLGSDLGVSSADDMITSYTSLVGGLHNLFPEMKIYIMQIPPVLYDTETLTNEMVNNYNSRLLDLANNIGVYCIDTNTALKAEDGRLDDSYWSYEELAISTSGLEKIKEYVLTHVI